MDHNQPDTLLTVAEAAGRLQVSTKTVRRYIAAGRLQAFRLGPTLLRLHAAEVDGLLRPLATASRPGAGSTAGVTLLARGTGRCAPWVGAGPLWLLTSGPGRQARRLA